MVYLITGGCGFIGSHIAEALVAMNHTVKIYDNLSSGNEENIKEFRTEVEFIRGDVRDERALQAAMTGVDHVFHQAALVSVIDSIKRPRENHEVNITGTLNILDAARAAGVKRLLMASSAAIYGNNPELPKREGMKPEPASPYGLAKTTAEHYLTVFAHLYGLETVSLRYFNVYGPRQDPSSMYSGVISRFVDAICLGQSPTVFGDGQQTRDFIFVKDVVEANLLAMHTDDLGRGEVLNVGTGEQTSLLDLLDTLQKLCGQEFQIEFREARPGDIRYSVADVTRMQRELGFTPHYSIRQGLSELLSPSQLVQKK